MNEDTKALPLGARWYGIGAESALENAPLGRLERIQTYHRDKNLLKNILYGGGVALAGSALIAGVGRLMRHKKLPQLSVERMNGVPLYAGSRNPKKKKPEDGAQYDDGEEIKYAANEGSVSINDLKPPAWHPASDGFEQAPLSSGKMDSSLPVYTAPAHLAALVAGGYGGYKLVDWIYNKARKDRSKDRLQAAQKEFDNAMLAMSKSSAVGKRIAEGFEAYKKGGKVKSAGLGDIPLTSYALAALGLWGGMKAYDAYNEYKAKDPKRDYIDKMERYIAQGQFPELVPVYDEDLTRKRKELREPLSQLGLKKKVASGILDTAWNNAKTMVNMTFNPTQAVSDTYDRFAGAANNASEDHKLNLLERRYNNPSTTSSQKNKMYSTIAESGGPSDQTRKATLETVRGNVKGLLAHPEVQAGVMEQAGDTFGFKQAGWGEDFAASAGDWVMGGVSNDWPQQMAEQGRSAVNQGVADYTTELTKKVTGDKQMARDFGKSLAKGQFPDMKIPTKGGDTEAHKNVQKGIEATAPAATVNNMKNPLNRLAAGAVTGAGNWGGALKGVGSFLSGAWDFVSNLGGSSGSDSQQGDITSDVRSSQLGKTASDLTADINSEQFKIAAEDIMNAFTSAGRNWGENIGKEAAPIAEATMSKVVDDIVAPKVNQMTGINQIGGAISRAFNPNSNWGNSFNLFNTKSQTAGGQDSQAPGPQNPGGPDTPATS